MSDTSLREKIRRLNRWREEMIRRAPAVSRLEKVQWLVKNSPDFMKAEDALNKLVGYRLKLLGNVDDEIAELERQWDQYDTPSGRRQQMDIEKRLEKLRKDKAGAADIDRNQLVKEVDPVKNYPTRVFHGTISDFVDAIKKHKKLKSPRQGAKKVSGGLTTESDIIWLTSEDWIANAYAAGVESKHEYNTKKGIAANYGGVFSVSLPAGLKLVDRYGALSDEQIKKLNSTVIPHYKQLEPGSDIRTAEFRVPDSTSLGDILEIIGVDGILMGHKKNQFSQIGIRDNIDLPVDVFYGKDRVHPVNEETEIYKAK